MTGTIVVKEQQSVVHARWGILTGLVLLGTAGILAFGKDVKGENLVVLLIMSGAGLALFVGRWIYEVRHPAFLEVGHPLITERRRGKSETLRSVQRTTGELTLEIRAMAPRSVGVFLTEVGGEQDGIEIGNYDRIKLLDACARAGWTYVPTDTKDKPPVTPS